MTVQESAICTLIQGFPVLLILAQNHNRCLKTPFVYKPPSPTPSPEYYEALDALFQTLYGHGQHDHHHGPHDVDHGCNGYHTYGTKWNHDYTSHHGHKPCYSHGYSGVNHGYPVVNHGYPGHGYGYPTYGYAQHGNGNRGHGPHYPSYIYGLKKINVYNTSNNHGVHGFKSYAPNQVYNVNQKYKIVVKKTRIGPHRRRSQKLKGFFPNQREDRRYGNQFGFVQNFLPNPNRIRDRLTGILHLRPENQNSNPSFIYPFSNRPGISNDGQNDQYGRPTYPYQNNQNYPITYPNDNQFNFGNPVEFPQTYPNQQYENQNPPSQINNDNTEFVSIENKPDVVQDTEQVSENPIPADVPIFDKPKDETPSFEDKNGESASETSETFPFPDEGKNAEQKPSQGFPTLPPGFVPPTGLPPLTPVAPEASTPPPQQNSPSWEPITGLPELTPVPASESRNNFNFGTQGIFQESCQTVEGPIGSCVSLYSCEPYVALLQQSQSQPALIQVLRKAHCGFEGNDPKVCCPRPGIPTGPPTPPPPPPVTTTTIAPVDEAAGKSADHADYLAAFPEPPVCGVSNASFSRVVGGVDAKLGDFPWMALLGYKSKRSGATRWLCGGSLVSSKHVLTAAHCINGHETDLYLVRLGELDLAKEDDGATPVDILIKTQIKHEKYDPNAYTDDIGLLVLERDVEFTSLIRPICIPRAAELRSNDFENYNPIIAGWGDIQFRGPSASHLQALQLPVVSNDFCKEAYVRYKKQVIDERVLCAGYKKGGKDACQGDSGGPLMQPIWNSQDYTTHFYQIGVVSFGYKCAEAGYPGIYSRVTHFVPWLEEQLLGSL